MVTFDGREENIKKIVDRMKVFSKLGREGMLENKIKETENLVSLIDDETGSPVTLVDIEDR